MLMIAEQLSALGVSKFLGQYCANLIMFLTSSQLLAAILLSTVYFFTMIMFSSVTGHALALCGPFMQSAILLKINPWLMTALLAYFSSLSACVVFEFY